jgi:mannose-1-phosphate guanylyltransferase
VRRFHEKPDRNTAERYLRAGDFFWNSGIFLWHARSFLRELERAMPELAVLVAELQAARDPRAFLPEFFRRAPAQSVDYGVLEESRRVVVVAAEFAWSDVGTWERWADLMPADDGENVRAGEVTSVESRGCVFFAEGGRVAALGVEDLVVVHTPQATLVLPKARSHEVRAILRALEHRGDRPR